LYNQTRKRTITPIEETWARFALWMAITVLVVIGGFYTFGSPFPVLHAYVQFPSLNFICAIPIAVLIFCVSRYNTWVSRILCGAGLVALGEISYSIYSVHTWTLRIFIRDPVSYSAPGAVDALFRVVLGIGLTLVVSTATYRLIELPGRTWLRGFFSRAAVSTFGARTANLREQLPGARQCVVAMGSLIVFTASCLAYQLN
jgi:peptidoglycan/LPS O-acetylase OafA/YrhL